MAFFRFSRDKRGRLRRIRQDRRRGRRRTHCLATDLFHPADGAQRKLLALGTHERFVASPRGHELLTVLEGGALSLLDYRAQVDRLQLARRRQ